MPLLLPRQGYGRWLSPDARTPELLRIVETHASTLTSYPVSSMVNSAANDDPRCAEPIGREV